MNRQRFCMMVLAFVCGTFAARASSQSPEMAPQNQGRVADLKEQLENGLQARLPREFRFIARVCVLVQNGTLPMKLVQSTFQWARRQVGAKKYPFPYFERALRIRAQRIGITI